MGLTIFVLLVVLLAALFYLVAVRRGTSPQEIERGRDKDDRHLPPW